MSPKQRSRSSRARISAACFGGPEVQKFIGTGEITQKLFETIIERIHIFSKSPTSYPTILRDAVEVYRYIYDFSDNTGNRDPVEGWEKL